MSNPSIPPPLERLASAPDSGSQAGKTSGIANPPIEPYVDPDVWQSSTPHQQGSWRPAWEGWLSVRSGQRIAPPPLEKSLCDTPDTYMYANIERP